MESSLVGHKVEVEDRAVLVIDDPSDSAEADANTQELRLLVESARVRLVDEMHVRRSHPDPAFHIGRGNAEEAFVRVSESGANVAIIGVDLRPSQQRNLEKALGVPVVDRTQLILDIFAARSRTSEGKLQVELAQLQYLLPRLAGKGIQMSQIGGSSSGGVATRGPGETKLETDRQRVRKRVSVLRDELEEVVKRRNVQAQSRRKLLVPRAALIGYTSAGKSTLLNTLAGAEVLADARLFATLDPTTRLVQIPGHTAFFLSDTVGFLSHLPHHLIAAFRATMEEVLDADFLIHVADAHHPHLDRQLASVAQVLEELGADEKPVVTAFNKCDIVRDQFDLRRRVAETGNSCYISALTGDGMQYVLWLIENAIDTLVRRVEVLLPFERGDLLAICHERGRVLDMEYTPEGVRVVAELSPDLAARLDPFQNR